MIPDPAPPFEVDAGGLVRERIRRMFDRAGDLGVRPAIAQALSAIFRHLLTDPRDWGDPLWHYRAAQMTRYGGTLGGFRCESSVHDRVPTVVLTDLYPLPGNPLHGETFEG
jgi:hypothetical protein